MHAGNCYTQLSLRAPLRRLRLRARKPRRARAESWAQWLEGALCQARSPWQAARKQAKSSHSCTMERDAYFLSYTTIRIRQQMQENITLFCTQVFTLSLCFCAPASGMRKASFNTVLTA